MITVVFYFQFHCYFCKLLFHHLFWYMFIVYVYVFSHEYIFWFAFICLHVFFLSGFNSLGVNIHTRALVWVDGTDTDKDVVADGRGRCTQI